MTVWEATGSFSFKRTLSNLVVESTFSKKRFPELHAPLSARHQF